jgi:hypothetical protein
MNKKFEVTEQGVVTELRVDDSNEVLIGICLQGLPNLLRACSDTEI